MDTVNHLNEHQLREELSRSQNTLAELQTNYTKLQREMDQINKGLCGFMTVLYGSPLPIASDALKEAVRKAVKDELEETCIYPKSALFKDAVREELSKATINTDNLELDIRIEAYTTEDSVTGKAYIVLPD